MKHLYQEESEKKGKPCYSKNSSKLFHGETLSQEINKKKSRGGNNQFRSGWGSNISSGSIFVGDLELSDFSKYDFACM